MSLVVPNAYRRRFIRVVRHIDRHLHEDLSLARLSEIAACSKYHFHRQFSELFGMGVYSYVRLVRLRRASFRLAFRTHERIVDIALASGYDSHDAFGRAFKKVVGQTPSEFRAEPRWDQWHAIQRPVRELRCQTMSQTPSPEDVRIVDFPATRVAMLEHRGDPNTIGTTIREFIGWRRRHGITRPSSDTFNLLHGDLRGPPEDFRLGLCAATERPLPEDELDVVERTIPAGRCAVLRHVGSDDALEATLHVLYGDWLPQSGEQLRDFPLFLHRVHFFPDVPEHEAITDVYLPLR